MDDDEGTMQSPPHPRILQQQPEFAALGGRTSACELREHQERRKLGRTKKETERASSRPPRQLCHAHAGSVKEHGHAAARARRSACGDRSSVRPRIDQGAAAGRRCSAPAGPTAALALNCGARTTTTSGARPPAGRGGSACGAHRVAARSPWQERVALDRGARALQQIIRASRSRRGWRGGGGERGGGSRASERRPRACAQREDAMRRDAILLIPCIARGSTFDSVHRDRRRVSTFVEAARSTTTPPPPPLPPANDKRNRSSRAISTPPDAALARDPPWPCRDCRDFYSSSPRGERGARASRAGAGSARARQS